jgi:hypothetical protein
MEQRDRSLTQNEFPARAVKQPVKPYDRNKINSSEFSQNDLSTSKLSMALIGREENLMSSLYKRREEAAQIPVEEVVP